MVQGKRETKAEKRKKKKRRKWMEEKGKNGMNWLTKFRFY